MTTKTQNRKTRQKPEHRYQPSKAELEKDLRIDASFEQLTKAVLKPSGAKKKKK